MFAVTFAMLLAANFFYSTLAKVAATTELAVDAHFAMSGIRQATGPEGTEK